MKTKSFPALMMVLSMVAAAFVIFTTLRGVATAFTAIPLEDEWDGFLGTVQQFYQGDQWNALWQVHVNHRLVIPRLIFLADVKWFGGWKIFTVVMSMLFAAVTSAIISARIEMPRLYRLIGIAAVFGLMFSWCNSDNFYFAFNVQNTSAVFFSVLALSEISREGNRALRVTSALVSAVLAELCAANGLLVFPVLLLQVVIMRQPIREMIAVVLVGALAIWAYMYQYVMPVYPVSPDVAQIHFVRLKFALLLAGAPFNRLLHSFNACAVIGALALVGGIALCIAASFRRRATAYRAFLIGGAAFCVISILAAANGRWMLGLQTALSARYLILPLLYYVFVVLLVVDVTKSRSALQVAVYAPLALLLVFVPAQAGSHFESNNLNQKLALLGEKIGLDQPYYDRSVYPASLHHFFIQLSDFANVEQIGVYSSGWLHDAGIVKYDPRLQDDSLCDGTFERIIKAESGHQVFGWLVPRKYGRESTLVVVTDPAGQTVGYGVTGMKRPDVKAGLPGAPSDAGWSGFVNTENVANAYAYIGGKFCELRRTVAK